MQADLKCFLFLWFYLIFSVGAMCLIAVPLATVFSQRGKGQFWTLYNLQTLTEANPGWQDVSGLTAWAQERTPADGCPCRCTLDIPFHPRDQMINLTPNNRKCISVYRTEQCDFSLGGFTHLIKMIFDDVYIVVWSYINLVLSAVTAITDK